MEKKIFKKKIYFKKKKKKKKISHHLYRNVMLLMIQAILKDIQNLHQKNLKQQNQMLIHIETYF